MSNGLKKLWKDPVVSKIIAEILMYIWINFVFGGVSSICLIITSMIKSQNIFYVFGEKINLIIDYAKGNITIARSTVLLYIIIYFAVRYLLSLRKSSKIKNYKSDVFLNANIKWDWVKESGKLVPDGKNIELICPDCNNNLEYARSDNKYVLSCVNCEFNSDPYLMNPKFGESMNGSFYVALKSHIDSVLRTRKLK